MKIQPVIDSCFNKHLVWGDNPALGGQITKHQVRQKQGTDTGNLLCKN